MQIKNKSIVNKFLVISLIRLVRIIIIETQDGITKEKADERNKGKRDYAR